mmetsp:Transcript_1972/g.5719  ORF Transcript_1972/g.5719 Transcript_1972/m.5719 type:complete len:213 (+) Transcript_1972:5254-5892(+)
MATASCARTCASWTSWTRPTRNGRPRKDTRQRKNEQETTRNWKESQSCSLGMYCTCLLVVSFLYIVFYWDRSSTAFLSTGGPYPSIQAHTPPCSAETRNGCDPSARISLCRRRSVISVPKGGSFRLPRWGCRRCANRLSAKCTTTRFASSLRASSLPGSTDMGSMLCISEIYRLKVSNTCCMSPCSVMAWPSPLSGTSAPPIAPNMSNAAAH